MRALFLMLLIPVISASQVQVRTGSLYNDISEVKRAGKFLASLQYKNDGVDTTYLLTIRNEQYQHILDIKSALFESDDNALATLKKAMLGCFADSPQESQLKLGDTDAYIFCKQQMGVKTVSFHLDHGYVILTEKQVKKLLISQ